MSIFLRQGILQQQANFRKKYALEFDGINDFILLQNEIFSSKIEIEIDLNNSENGSEYFLSGSSIYNGFRYNDNDGTLLLLASSNFTTFPYVKKPGYVKLLAQKISGTGWAIYENGSLIKSNAAPDEVIACKGIGQYITTAGNWFEGKIKSLKIWDNSDNLAFEGDFTRNDLDRFYDISGNENHGTINGATWIEI